MNQAEYVFHRAEDQQELERLRMIERECDPASRRRLLATGLQAGWTCLEVGPGAGSMLDWMSGVVGPSGHVCGIDLSMKFLSGQRPSHVKLQEGDIRTTPLLPASFDLVHTRYVLVHLTDVDTALSKMLACLKPGGWLVLEEPDFSASRGVTGEPEQLDAVTRVNQAIRVMYERLGMDFALGLTLPARLQRCGIRDLRVECDAPLIAGGAGLATVMKLSAVQLREKYLATGVVSTEDLQTFRRFSEDPRSWAIYYATVAVLGRTP